MKNLSILALMFTSLMVIGCATPHGNLMKSAQMNYQANQYEAALRDAVGALKLKPDFANAQDMIETYFKAAVDERESKIKSLEATSGRFKWDGIVAEYKGLIEINRLVKNLPPMALTHKKTARRLVFDTKDYTDKLAQASERAAEVHYQEGIRLAASAPAGDVNTQKNAAKAFKKANEFMPGYKDAERRYEQSRAAGVKKLAILPFEDKSGKAHIYPGITNKITDQIIANVVNDASATEFLQLVTRDDLDSVMDEQRLGLTGIMNPQTAAQIGDVAGAHEILIGQVNSILVEPAETRSPKYKVENTISVRAGKETYTDSDGKIRTKTKWVDKKVYATVTHYVREGSASIDGSFKIIDAKTAAMKTGGSDTFEEKYQFKAEWAEFTGNQKALKGKWVNLVQATEQRAPTKEKMVHEAVSKLSERLAEKLKAYAR